VSATSAVRSLSPLCCVSSSLVRRVCVWLSSRRLHTQTHTNTTGGCRQKTPSLSQNCRPCLQFCAQPCGSVPHDCGKPSAFCQGCVWRRDCAAPRRDGTRVGRRARPAPQPAGDTRTAATFLRTMPAILGRAVDIGVGQWSRQAHRPPPPPPPPPPPYSLHPPPPPTPPTPPRSSPLAAHATADRSAAASAAAELFCRVPLLR
jgi:hypothetical protein